MSHTHPKVNDTWQLNRLIDGHGVRAKFPSKPAWTYGRVVFHDENGNANIRWFECTGPMGDVEDVITSHSFAELRSMSCELYERLPPEFCNR